MKKEDYFVIRWVEIIVSAKTLFERGGGVKIIDSPRTVLTFTRETFVRFDTHAR